LKKLLLFLLLFSSCFSADRAQRKDAERVWGKDHANTPPTNKTGNDTARFTTQNYPAFPERVLLANISPSKPIQERNESEFRDSFVANFHPIGWSKDGKAAYLTWSEGEFYADMGVIIYDAVNDSIVASWFDDFGEEDRLTIEQVRLLWKSDKDSVLPLLNKYQIVADANALYRDFPFSYSTEKNKKDISVEYSTHVSVLDERFQDSLFISCMINTNEKTDTLKMRYGNYYDVDIFPAGIWMSPDKKYTLLAIITETGGQHGTELPHNIEFNFKAIKLPE
jgi:hypothetical protein